MTSTSCIKRTFWYAVDWSVPGGLEPDIASIAALSLTGLVYNGTGANPRDAQLNQLNTLLIADVFLDPANDQAVLDILAKTPNVLTYSTTITLTNLYA
ncbi:hypothetical protein [Ktedonobacter robiniae]|uniref:Uncharacterized protein n=1 Tax=Ktedonobacter robiniae TaxID=2778365 RepID=A0ABQ3USG4_9CHLR|nr:hypothetical protein [Ktedonobacter robiniae]GHO55532.1 hypothetical protein KSB_40070 [Ktedonobacter robiniae]